MDGRHLIKLVLLFLLIHSLESLASSGITYHGRLLNPDGTPSSSTSVQFKMQIRTPGIEDCLLYEEIQNHDLSATNGMFAISLGDGSGTRQDSNTWSLFDALSNRKNFSFAVTDCVGPNSYAPATTDNRRFKVLFNDGSFPAGTWEALPLQTINYIPMSIESYAVGGFPASSLLRVETAGTLGTTTPLTSTQYTEILALVSGTSSQYEQNGELNGSALPTISSGESVRWTGSAWQAFTPLTSETDPNVEAFAKSSLPTCATGEVLKSDGTSLSCVTDAGGWSAVDATTTVKGIVNVPTAGGLEVSSGAIGLPDVVTGGTYTKVTVDAKGRVTTGANITGSDITSGTIGGSTSISTTGSVSAASMSVRQIDLYDSDNSHHISFLTPATTDLTSNYDLVFPSSLGTSNQILGMNAAGDALENKSITAGSGVTITHSAGGIAIAATGSGGTVTSVTGTSPISVATGTTTPVISLDDTGTAGTYGSSTEVPVFTTDAKGRVTSVTETTISGVSPVGSTLSTGQVWVGDGSNEAQERFIGVEDLKTVLGTAQIPTSCTAAQTMTWSAVTDVFSCVNISIASTQVSGLGTAAIEDVGTSAGDVVQLDGTAKIPVSLLPSSTGDIKDGGNSTGATVVVGTNDAQSFQLETNNSAAMTILSGGNVGIGTTNPSSKLDISGTIQIANGGETCSATADGGMIRYNGGDLQFCNESAWQTLGVSGAGLSSLNGQTGSTQTFATPGSSGNAPNWSSSSNAHTLNIPMASSGASVTAGLLSNTEYVALNSKLSSTLASTNILVGNSSNVATARAISGDATLSNIGVLTLKNTGTAGTYGSSTEVAVITTDAQGRVTSVTETAITGISPVGSNLTSTNIWVGDGSNQAAAVAMSGDATMANDGTLTLKNTGTAGTYRSVTTDAQGRVTSGTNPTTLSGYGITDAIQNAGGTISIQSGLSASRPLAGTAGRLYFSTDDQEISRDNGSSWDVIASGSGSGGTVTSVSGTSPIQVATGTTTPVISIDDATTTTKGAVQISSTGGIDIASGVISLADTGTAGTYGSSTEVAVITTDAKGRVTSVTETTIAGTSPVGSTLSSGEVWVGDGSNLAQERFFGVGDLRTALGAAQIPSSCTSAQTMVWSAITDIFSCTSISITASQVSDFPTLGTAAAKNFGTSSGNLVELDGAGRIPASLLPATAVLQNGNSFSATAVIGTNDNQSLELETNGSTRLTISSTGNVAIGGVPSSYMLDVTGTLNATELRMDGTVVTSGIQGAVTTVATLGASCSMVGQLAKDNSGNLMVCDDTPSALTTTDCSTLGVGAVTFNENGELYVCAN